MKNKYFWRNFFSGFFSTLYYIAIASLMLTLLGSIMLLMFGATAKLLPYLDITYQCIIAFVISSAIFVKLTA